MTDIFLSERRMLKQMFLVRIGLAIAFGAFSATTCHAAKVSLFDASGEAVAYIDTDDELTIYLWSGKPVAYIWKM
jgi:4-fold beta flower protein